MVRIAILGRLIRWNTRWPTDTAPPIAAETLRWAFRRQRVGTCSHTCKRRKNMKLQDGLDDMIRDARQDALGLGSPAAVPPVGHEDHAARIVSSGKYGSHARLSNWPCSNTWEVFIPHPLEVGAVGMCRVTRHIAGRVEGEFFPSAGGASR